MTPSIAIRNMMTASSYFVLEDPDGPYPCTCCSPQSAWDGDRWNCSKRSWILMDTPPDLSQPHDSMICEGSCGNPLHSLSIFDKAALFDIGFGDLLLFWEEEAFAALSPAEQARIVAKKDADFAEEEALRPIKIESYRIAEKARSHEIMAHCKGAKPKQMRPCKYLYSCDGDRKTGGARPTTLHITSECWSHSYTDPLTKKVISKHACWFVHPGEAGWCKEWEKNRNFVPSGSAANVAAAPLANFRGPHGGNAAPQPRRDWRSSTAAPPPPPPNPQFKNRFSNLDSW